MRIAVVSDTHGHVPHAQAAVRVLEELEIELLLHCGDIGSTAIPPLFAGWPAHYVFGNVDHDEQALRQAIAEAGGTCHGRFGVIEPAGKRIVFLHGDDGRRFRETCSSGEWDLVCYGHTHKADVHREGHTLVLNPGALYRASRHTIALVELPELEITHLDV